MYNQRHVAQNSAEAAALAGTKVMLDAYDQMILDNAYDVDGTMADEAAISSTITAYANLYGIQRSNLQAYYINDAKQIVTSAEVGSYQGVPWTLGAKGIAVKNRSEIDSFFMKIIRTRHGRAPRRPETHFGPHGLRRRWLSISKKWSSIERFRVYEIT